MTISDLADPFLARASEIVRDDLENCCERLTTEFGSMRGSRVLLTGGAGFLGYYLVQVLLEWNRRVPTADAVHMTVIDSFVRGPASWLTALDAPQLRVVQHDITTPVPEACGEFDYVIHAASIASPTFYRRRPIDTMDANVNGLRLLLERARRQRGSCPVRGFLYFSSSEIYGQPEPSAIPTPETYPGRVSSTGPRACYDESKRYGETLAVNFAQQYELPITIVRPFNNYGPGLKLTDRRVIPDLARDLLSGRDMVLHSDGSPSRTFCYITDALTGYYKALTRGRAGETYNIGCDAPEISMRELADRLASIARELFGYDGTVVVQASSDARYLTDNPQRRCPDISKARRELGFAPAVTADEGLRRTLTWYAGNREGEDG